MMQQAEQVQSTALSVLTSAPMSLYTGKRASAASSDSMNGQIRGTLIRISVSIASTAATLSVIASMLRAYIKRNETAAIRQRYIDLENERERLSYRQSNVQGQEISASGGFSLMDFITSTPMIIAALTGLAAYLLPEDLKSNLLQYGKNLLLSMTGLDEAYKELEQSFNNAKTKLEEFFTGELTDTLADIATELSLVLAGLTLIKTGKRPTTTTGRGPRISGRGALGGALTALGAAGAVETVTGGGLSSIYNDVSGWFKEMLGITEHTETPPTERAAKAMSFFIEKGYTPEQAAGMVGNLQAESGVDLNPRAVGDNGTAYGIAQWRGGRQKEFFEQFKKPIEDSTFDEQLEFIVYELENYEKGARDALKKTKTPSQAAEVFARKYERPQLDPSKVDPSKVIGKRQGFAENLYGNYLKDRTERSVTSAATNIVPSTGASSKGVQAINTSVQNADMKENAGRTSVVAGSLPASATQVGDKPPAQKPTIPRPVVTTPELDRSMFFSPAY